VPVLDVPVLEAPVLDVSGLGSRGARIWGWLHLQVHLSFKYPQNIDQISCARLLCDVRSKRGKASRAG
jgi:hypothetical protein